MTLLAFSFRRTPGVVVAALASIVCIAGSLNAQESASRQSTASQCDVQQFRQELQSMDARITQLEKERMAQNVSRGTAPPVNPPGKQTLTGRLTCANLSTGAYSCGKGQTLWGCTLQCIADGSPYVLVDGHQPYVVVGDPSQLKHFAADNVVLTGEITDSKVNVYSIERMRKDGRK